TTRYKYDSFGRMLTLTYPDKETVSYHYDDGGELKSVTGVLGSRTTNYVTEMTHDEFGQLVKVALGNGVVTTYLYEPRMRWVSQITSGANVSTVFQREGFTFDLVGNILTATNSITRPTQVSPAGSIAPGPTSFTYTYDKLYQ